MRLRHRPGGPQPNGVETSLRRPHLSRKDKVEKILEAIPYDGWVSAAEIAAETGIDSYRVAGVIRRNLLNVYIERKSMGPKGRKYHLYRRLHRVGKTKNGDRWP
jgi:hypothetical protein